MNVSPDVRYPVLGARSSAAAASRATTRSRGRSRAAADRPGRGHRRAREVTGFVRGRRRTRRGGRDVAGHDPGRTRWRWPPRATRRVLASMVGLRLPLQSHPLQALVSVLLEPVLGLRRHVQRRPRLREPGRQGRAGDGRGHRRLQLATRSAARSTSSSTRWRPRWSCSRSSRTRTLLRTWGGIVDVCPDASPIIGPTPIDGLFLNCGWGTGGFKATPGSGWVYADTIANGEPHPLAEPYALERFTTGALDRRARRRGGRALRGCRMLLIPCPWCGPRDETEFRYGGQAGLSLPGRSRTRSSDEAWADFLFMRDNPKGPFDERWMHAARMPPVVQRRARHRRRDRASGRSHRRKDEPPDSRRLETGGLAIDRSAPSRFIVRRAGATRVRRRHAGVGPAGERRRRRVRVADPGPAARGVLGRRRGAERVRRGRRAVRSTRSCAATDGRARLTGSIARRLAGCRPAADRATHRPPLRAPARRTWRLLVVGAAGLRGRRGAGERRRCSSRSAAARWHGERDGSMDGPGAPDSDDVAVLTPRRPHIGLYDGRHRARRHERNVGPRPGERLWHVRAAASCSPPARTNGRSRSRDNDRPGVMLAGAAVRYADDSACGRTSGPSSSRRTTPATTPRLALAAAGVEIAAIVDVSRARRRPMRARARRCDVRDRRGRSTGARREPRVSAVHLPARTATADTIESDLAAGRRRLEPGDPALARHRRRPPRSTSRRACFVPDGERSRLALGRRAPRRGEVPTSSRSGSRRPRTCSPALRRPPARLDGRRRPRRRRPRPAHRRARQARRRTSAPANDQGRTSRRAHRRDREPGVGPDPARRARRRSDPRTRRSRSASLAGHRPRPRCSTRSARRRSMSGTSSTARRSRTSASGSGRGTSRRASDRWTTAVPPRVRSRSGPASA